MAAEQDRWIEAIAVHTIYGLEAQPHLTERMDAFALVGDTAGIEWLMEISVRVDQIMRGLI